MESEAVDLVEELTQKHKKEKKELQSKIQVLKKSAIKGDKKKKKEVQEEISKLESELAKRHDEELSLLKTGAEAVDVKTDLIESLETVQVSDSNLPPKASKAQKRREKKAAEMKEREQRILEQEIENESGQRNVEIQTIKELLKKQGLMIYDIEADGNCLYNAVDHQLKSKTNFTYGTKQLRLETSNHMRCNHSEYLPFLTNPSTGDMMTEEEFNEYCNNVANTTNWGGQIELRALSHVVKKPITVIQADAPPLIMGEEYSDNESLVIAYHRHMYRLGEHYNSVQPYVDESDNV